MTGVACRFVAVSNMPACVHTNHTELACRRRRISKILPSALHFGATSRFPAVPFRTLGRWTMIMRPYRISRYQIFGKSLYVNRGSSSSNFPGKAKDSTQMNKNNNKKPSSSECALEVKIVLLCCHNAILGRPQILCRHAFYLPSRTYYFRMTGWARSGNIPYRMCVPIVSRHNTGAFLLETRLFMGQIRKPLVTALILRTTMSFSCMHYTITYRCEWTQMAIAVIWEYDAPCNYGLGHVCMYCVCSTHSTEYVIYYGMHVRSAASWCGDYAIAISKGWQRDFLSGLNHTTHTKIYIIH